ncbi:MAG: hypothetical protein J3Q66DRAFT_387812 [Benniella sp.]|nr:MAG: hypothetical protein J3Q66DRAFT_387812 [Benniella sp.]
MEFDAPRFANSGGDLDIDLAMPTDTADTALGTAAPADAAYRNSMLALEQELEEQTRDISSRFHAERRPQPAGLDRALGDYNSTDSRSPRGDNTAQLKYASRHGGFVTGFDPLSKEEQAKKANRALRFGASPQVEEPPRDDAMDDQGASMDVDEGEWVRPSHLPQTPPRTSTIRLEAVHLYGTNEMSTKDVLKYFDAYGPSHVEWIDDFSCNIVFPDQFSAKRALYFQLVDRNVNFGEDEVEPGRAATESGTVSVTTMEGDDASIVATDATQVVMVPKSNNRLQRAKDYIPPQQPNQTLVQSNRGLFVRYATDYDRKERGAASKSQYYAIHGREDPNQQRSTHESSSMGTSRYGRRSRADEDEIWNRGRGIMSLSKLRRRFEDGSASPSPTREEHHSTRSWSRNRRLADSRSRSGSRSRSRSSSRSRGRSGSRSPGYYSRRERASQSPDSRGRMRADEYERRGRRGDISLRLGGRVKFPDVDQVEAVDPSGEATPIALYTSRTESRLNQYADDFLAELESTFSRREKAIPKTRLYSDYYEREVTTEAPTDSQAAPASGRGRRNRERERDRDRDRDRDRNRNRRSDSRDRRHGSGRADEWTVFAGASAGSPSGGRGRRGGDSRNERGKEHEEALRALDARLGLPADDRVDEFGRARRD